MACDNACYGPLCFFILCSKKFRKKLIGCSDAEYALDDSGGKRA